MPTHGQSELIFGLAYLLGIKLMPRMRTWNDVHLCRTCAQVTYKHIDSLLVRTIDWKLIDAYFDDLMQVALSIQAGTILPSMLLRRVGIQNRQNQLYRAFRELGRTVRTVFLLKYMTTLELRQTIQAATTKVESYHAFTDWLSFGGHIVRTGDPVEQQKRIKYRDVVANAVMLHNVADVTDILSELHAEGAHFTREQVACLSPSMTAHLKRFGQYILDMDHEPPTLRPVKLVFADELC